MNCNVVNRIDLGFLHVERARRDGARRPIFCLGVSALRVGLLHVLRLGGLVRGRLRTTRAQQSARDEPGEAGRFRVDHVRSIPELGRFALPRPRAVSPVFALRR